MKTLLVLLLTATCAFAAQRDADARHASRQAAIDARIWQDAVAQSKSKPDPAAYLKGVKQKQDALKAKRAQREKAVADRNKQKRVKTP